MSRLNKWVLCFVLSICFAWSLGTQGDAQLCGDEPLQSFAAAQSLGPDEFCGTHQQAQSLTATASDHKVCCKNPTALEPCQCEAISSCQCLRDDGQEQAAPLVQQEKLAGNPTEFTQKAPGYISMPNLRATDLSVQGQRNDGPPDRPPRLHLA